MIKIKISPILVKLIKKTFKQKAKSVFGCMDTLKKNPSKGDLIAQIDGIQLREIRYDSLFRFYYFSNLELIKILDKDELSMILIKFEAMSKKDKDQQKVINTLKKDLKKYGFEYF